MVQKRGRIPLSELACFAQIKGCGRQERKSLTVKMIINAIKTPLQHCITVLITLSEETEHSQKVINVCVNIDLSVIVT